MQPASWVCTTFKKILKFRNIPSTSSFTEWKKYYSYFYWFNSYIVNLQIFSNRSFILLADIFKNVNMITFCLSGENKITTKIIDVNILSNYLKKNIPEDFDITLKWNIKKNWKLTFFFALYTINSVDLVSNVQKPLVAKYLPKSR